MVQLIQSLGRLSVRGYLVIAGFIAIAVLANYSNLQSQLQIAAQQAKQQASERAHTEDIRLKAAEPAAQPTSDQLSSASGGETSATQQSASVQAAQSAAKNNTAQGATVINGGALVFSPTNVTLSLSGTLPLFTVAAPGGAPISVPSLVSSSGTTINLKATGSSSGSKPSWSMQLVGKPKPGTYHLPVHATTTQGTDIVEYTGTLTVVVLL